MQRRGRERLDGLAAGVGSELGLEALEGSGVSSAVEGLGDGVVGRAVAGRPREVGRLAQAGGREREVLGPRGEVGVEGRGDDGERVGSGSADTLPDSVDENGREVAEKRRTRKRKSQRQADRGEICRGFDSHVRDELLSQAEDSSEGEGPGSTREVILASGSSKGESLPGGVEERVNDRADL